MKARNYETKAVSRAQAPEYASFGWIRSREPVPQDMMKRRQKNPVLMKRKLDFGLNAEIRACEKQYERLAKRKYRAKPLLGILSFILMLAFLAVAGVELYYGISRGADLKKSAKEETSEADEAGAETAAPANADGDEAAPAEESPKEGEAEGEGAAGEAKSGGIKAMLDKAHDEYLSKITKAFEGKTDAETGERVDGIADKLGSALGGTLADFVSADTLVGLIALILGIVFLALFASVCSIKRKRMKNEDKKAELCARASRVANDMRSRDLSLMGKTQRKQYVWESIITNAIRNANATDDDDDDEF